MRFGKGGTPVWSYVLVGLRMQLGETLHMQAREQGGGGRRGKRGCFGEAKGIASKKKNFGVGEKQRPKEVLLDVPSMKGLIDQMGLRIRMSKLYQESQLNLQPGALVISKKLRITFTCFQTKAAPTPRVQIQIKKNLG